MASASAGADPLALLPSSDDAFRRKQYWDSFFAKRGSRAFEWYGSWGDVKGPLSKLADKDGAIVVVGCGNSDLSSDMYDAGLRNITSLDYSEGVVAEMAAKNASREGMKWLVADARATGLPSDSVLLVVDKGTLDAMLPEASAEAASDAASLLAEGMRLVRPGGSYACVSLLQDQVLACLAASVGHDDSGFRVDVAPFEPAERSPLCPFLVVITKPDPSSAAADPRDVAAGVVEGMSGSLGGVWRFHDDASHIGAAGSPFDPETIPDTASLRRLVSAAAFRHRSREALRSTVPGQALSMALFDGRGAAAGTPGSAEPTPRFTLFAVDASARRTCSALVIPSGREAEWVFGTDEGRASLAADAGAGRLLLVRRNKGHTFPADEAAVREELAGSVASAAPEGLEGPIAWLGVATDGDIVETVAEVTSGLSGGMAVEDVPDEGAAPAAGEALGWPRRRRLVFFSNQAAVQSEALLTAAARPRRRRRGGAAKAASASAAGSDGPSWDGLPAALSPTSDLPPPAPGTVVPSVDFSSLAFEYHRAAVACLAIPAAQAAARALASPPDALMRVCVLGLGGGGLPMFLARGLGGGAVPTAPAAPRPPAGPVPYGCCPADGVPGSGAPLVRALPPPVRVHSVELDPVVASVARDHFGFAPDDRCRLTVADGVEHILARADAAPSRPDLSLDALVIDVDAKDLSSGLSFPPKVFLDPPFLRAARACLRPGGCVVFNIACRVPTVLEAVLADVAAAFDWAMQTQITDGTLNRLVVAGTNPATDDAGTPLLRLPSGRRAISDAVEAWLSPTTPSGAAACTVRGSAPCSFAGLDLDAFNGWVRDLKWLKRPDEAFLDEEDATAAPADTAVASKAGGGGRKRAGKGRKKRR